MDDSILTSIKKLLGIAEEYTHFDTDIMIHLNSIFFTLSQIGVGPTRGFSISDKSKVWSEYISEDQNLESVKSYMFLKIKLIFDPPTSASVINALNESIKEFEWRLNVATDSGAATS